MQKAGVARTSVFEVRGFSPAQGQAISGAYVPTRFVGVCAPIRISGRRHAEERHVCATRRLDSCTNKGVRYVPSNLTDD
jgi:hypothetical protein